jgi:hypothetical protein
MFTAWILKEAIEIMRAEPIADGHEPMISADVVPKVLCLSHG